MLLYIKSYKLIRHIFTKLDSQVSSHVFESLQVFESLVIAVKRENLKRIKFMTLHALIAEVLAN